ncbi:MAG: MBL fold metallo-hydrolase [Candidatus Altiarchaeota archaeon]
MIRVVVIKEGVKNRELRGKIVHREPVSSSVTLIRTNVNIIVDTACRGDANIILEGLSAQGLEPYDVDYVINTHWHPDHTSNNHLFSKARIIIGESTWMPGVNTNHGSWEDEVDGMDGVRIIRTPGHVPEHISVIAESDRRYVMAGDAFYEKDLREGGVPKTNSSIGKFKESALRILEEADVIIPGHGRVIELDEESRKEFIRLVHGLG